MGTDRSVDREISRFEFETQARDFDARAGLGERAAGAVGEAIATILGVGPTDPLLEVGAGTGEVGIVLAAKTSGYIGLDASAAMLDVFRERARPLAPHLVVGDANRRWPVADRSMVGIYFGRVLHLLDVEHVRAEILRVGSPRGVAVVIGRRRRDPSSPIARLRREARILLESMGIERSREERAQRALIDGFLARGATPIPTTVAARTEVRGSLRAAAERFRSKRGFGGTPLPRAQIDAVVDEATRNLVARGEDLDEMVATIERFELEGFRLGPP